MSSLTRGPPHSTRLLALIYVKKLIRILAISGRTLAINGRILSHKMQLRSQKSMSRNYRRSLKNRSKNIKKHENTQECPPSRKISPQDRKRSENGSIIPRFWTPSEHLKSAEVGKEGVSKTNVFLDTLLEPTFPHFRPPQAPKKQPT